MTEKIKELLSVLDMSEEEQSLWLRDADYTGFTGTPNHPHERALLADLAFRLRDENKEYFVFGLIEVFQYKTNLSKREIPSPAKMITESTKIDWIIAAMIATCAPAKEMS